MKKLEKLRTLYACVLGIIFIFGLTYAEHYDPGNVEIGDALYREGFGPYFWDLGHAGLFWYTNPLTGESSTIESAGYGKGVISQSFDDFYEAAEYWGPGIGPHSQPPLSSDERRELIRETKRKLGYGYTFGFWYKNSSRWIDLFKLTWHVFRCDGLVEKMYEHVNHNIVGGLIPCRNDMDFFCLWPSLQSSKMDMMHFGNFPEVVSFYAKNADGVECNKFFLGEESEVYGKFRDVGSGISLIQFFTFTVQSIYFSDERPPDHEIEKEATSVPFTFLYVHPSMPLRTKVYDWGGNSTEETIFVEVIDVTPTDITFSDVYVISLTINWINYICPERQDACHFELWRKIGGEAGIPPDGYTCIKDNISGTSNSYSDENLEVNTKYWYALRVCTNSGNYTSDFSNPMCVTLLPGTNHGGEDWIISEDVIIGSNHCNINNFRITGTNTVVEVLKYDSEIDTSGWLIVQANNMEIDGKLLADTTGYGPSEGPGAGTDGSKNYGAGGAGYGGRGGDGKGGKAGGSAYADSVFGNPGTYDWEMGSGGGNSGIAAYKGGVGGGKLKLVCSSTMTIDGNILVNGGNGSGWGAGAYTSGGGSGGSIWLLADSLAGDGTISANGGNGYDAGWSDAGGGAGGRVHIKYGGSSFNGEVSVNGGDGPDKALSGQMGSIWIEQKEGLVNIGISSVNTSGTRSSPEGSISGVEFKREDVNLSDNSIILGNTYIKADNSIVIATGSSINASSKGYHPSEGPGAGTDGSKNYGAGGAGYGGNGGDGKGGKAGGSAYGSADEPSLLGSGGGNSGITAYEGGAGGGRIKLDSPTGSIIIDGTMSTNGGNGNGWGAGDYTSGGGSGGSIWLIADSLAGDGTISVNGGNGYDAGWSDAGGGAGGRVCLARNKNFFTGTVEVNGGMGPGNAQDGEVGTVYLTVGGGTQGIDGEIMPMVFNLSQNYPNPFVKLTTIKYQIPIRSKVSLKIYDVTGRCVKTLIDGEKNIGYYKVKWDGEGLSTGIYFAKFKAGDYKETKKLILMR